MLLLIDCSNGMIKHLRLIGLGSDFSRALLNEINELHKKPFSKLDYQNNLNRIYSYSTKELSKMMIHKYKSRDHKEPLKYEVNNYVEDSIIKYSGLPEELKPHYCYMSDGGHSVMCIPSSLLEEAKNTGKFDDYKVPIPVKYVIKMSYDFYNGNVIVDIEYDKITGAVIDESYVEH